jgi:hypothetical protein
MLTTILRTESGPERMLIGILSWVFLVGIIALFKGAKKAVKGKKFEEGDKTKIDK